MATQLYSHPSFLAHETPHGHPERADRLRAIEHVLEQERFHFLQRLEAPLGTREQIIRAHPEELFEMLQGLAPTEETVSIDADTTMSPGTWEAALRAVGASCAAVDAVLAKEARNAFCAIRPPGHHAEYHRAMGFCFFNNAAVAARHAQSKGIGRVAIVDWDVHHGNGTQDIFWGDSSVMYCSTHQMPLYPGTGAANERGEHDTIVNAPLRAGDDGIIFKEAFEALILPRLASFEPELVIISAGFDAHRRDPLGNLELTEHDFAWATRQLMEIAGRHAEGRVVSLLEGGYDLTGLARSVEAHIGVLMGG